MRFFSPLRSAQNDIPDFLTFARGLLTAGVQVSMCCCANVSELKAIQCVACCTTLGDALASKIPVGVRQATSVRIESRTEY